MRVSEVVFLFGPDVIRDLLVLSMRRRSQGGKDPLVEGLLRSEEVREECVVLRFDHGLRMGRVDHERCASGSFDVRFVEKANRLIELLRIVLPVAVFVRTSHRRLSGVGCARSTRARRERETASRGENGRRRRTGRRGTRGRQDVAEGVEMVPSLERSRKWCRGVEVVVRAEVLGDTRRRGAAERW